MRTCEWCLNTVEDAQPCAHCEETHKKIKNGGNPLVKRGRYFEGKRPKHSVPYDEEKDYFS